MSTSQLKICPRPSETGQVHRSHWFYGTPRDMGLDSWTPRAWQWTPVFKEQVPSVTEEA